MSAYVLNQASINTLTAATAAALQMSRKYPGSYPLHKDTLDLLGKYADDLHNVYRALYITNIKAVNGRYGEDTKTLPKYKPVMAWDWGRGLSVHELKKACGLFGCYLYQCSEDPVYGSPVFNAFTDIYHLLCALYVSKTVDWNGEDDE